MAGKHRVPRRPQNVTETSDYVAMMTRIITAYGDRIAADSAALAHLRDLQATMAGQVNRGIFEANASSAHYSQNEMARILGVSRQAIAKRIGLGEEVYARTWEARGAGALVRIADVRARRAQLLADAGVQDRTGSALELRPGRGGDRQGLPAAPARGVSGAVDAPDGDQLAPHPVHHPVGAGPEPVVIITPVKSPGRLRVIGQGGDGCADGAHAVLVPHEAADRCPRLGRPLD